MMDIPSFPTDNLYKFLTLFGLALILSGIALPIYEEHYYAELTRDLFSKAISGIGEGILAAADAGKAPNSTAATKVVTDGLEKMRTTIVSSLELVDAAHRVERSRRIGWCGVVLGFISSILGFRLWYRLHQKYQDKILVNRSQLLNPDSD